MKKAVKLILASMLVGFFLFPNIWMVYQVTGEATGPVTYQIDIIPIGILQQTNTTVRALAKVVGTLFLDNEGTPVTGADVSYEFVTARIDGAFAEEDSGVYRTQLWMEIDVQYEESGEVFNSTLGVRPLVSENENWVLNVRIENASTAVSNVRIIDYAFEGGRVHYDINSTFSSIQISGAALPSPHSYEIGLSGQVGFALEGHHSPIEPIKGARISYEIPGTEFKGEITGTADGRYDVEFNETIILKIHPKITISPEIVLLSTNGEPARQTLRVAQEVALTYAKNITLIPSELICQPSLFIPAQSITISQSGFDLTGISQKEVSIEVDLPEDTPPGLYAGEITVQTSEEEVTVPLLVCNRHVSPSFVEDYVLDRVQEVLQTTIQERMNLSTQKDGYAVNRTTIQTAIDRILASQKRDGGFADARITCLAIMALLESEKLGYSVNRTLVQKAIDWLISRNIILLNTATFDRYSSTRLATPKKPLSMYPDPSVYDLKSGSIEPREKRALFISTLALAQDLNYTINRNLVQQTIRLLELEAKQDNSYGSIKISSWILRSLVLAEARCFTVNSFVVEDCADWLKNQLEQDLAGKLEGDPNAQVALMALVEADNSCFEVNQTIVQLVADYLDGKDVGIYYELGLKVQGLVNAESSVYSVNRTRIQDSVNWLLDELEAERVSEMENVASVTEALVKTEDAGWANKLDWRFSRLQIKLENLVHYMQGISVAELTPDDEIKFYQEVALRLKETIFQTMKLAYLVLHPDFSEAIDETISSMEDKLTTALVVSEGRLAKLGGSLPPGKLEVTPRPIMYVTPTVISKTIAFGGVETETVCISNLGNLKMTSVHLSAIGEIANWTAFDKDNFDIEIQESESVNATFSPPSVSGPVPEEDLFSSGEILVTSINDGSAEVNVEMKHLVFIPHPTPDYVPPEIPKMDPLLYEVAETSETINAAIDFYQDPTDDQIKQLENMGVKFLGTGVPFPDYSLDAIVPSNIIDQLEQVDFIKRVWSYTGRGASSLLNKSVDFIGAKTLNGLGYDGSSIPVGIIDTGIAHYHNDATSGRILSEYDYGADLGQYTNIAVDSNGYPHICYYYKTEMRLKYARWDGSEWHITTVDDSGSCGDHCSIALDSNNNPCISYRFEKSLIQEELRFARWDGNEWNIQTIDSPFADIRSTSVAIASDSTVHIAYSQSNLLAMEVKHAQWDGSKWSIKQIDSMPLGGLSIVPTDLPVEIELGSNGRPHVTYFFPFLSVAGSLRYAKYEAGTWQHTEVQLWAGAVTPAVRLSMIVDKPVDSDGDGLTDLEEIKMSLDPHTKNEFWALIVSGSPDLQFSNNTGYMHHILTEHYDFDGMYYLDADPSRPGVDAISTKQNVRNAITDWLATRSDANDVVVIYFSSHGGGYETDTGINYGVIDANGDEGNEISEASVGQDLNNDGDMTDWVGIDESLSVQDGSYLDDELASDLDTLTCSRLVFIRQGCFGGGIIDDISKTDRIVMTATDETHSSYGDQDGKEGFSEWSDVFLDALHRQGARWDGTSKTLAHEGSRLTNVDTNEDGYVSLEEAWTYAWSQDIAGPEHYAWETPWQDDNGNSLPTFANGADQSDVTDGALASKTWLRSKPKVNVNIVFKYNTNIKHAELSFLDTSSKDPISGLFYSNWEIADVDTVSSIYVCPSVAIDSQKRLHLSYGDYSNGKLMLEYSLWDGDRWLTSTVESTDGWALLRWQTMWSSIGLDSSDNPRIAFYDPTIRSLKCAMLQANGEWNIERLDSVPAIDTAGHGSHVAGIIGGSGPVYTGVAPGASFIILKYDSSSYDYTQSTTRVAMYEAYHKYKAIVQSNSWGWFIWSGDATDPICKVADDLVRNGAVIVVAAGNEGEKGVRSPGASKNVITVGALSSSYDSEYGGPSAIASFSSRGPTGDGRYKPDLVAPGVNIVSLSNKDLNNNGILDDYVSMSGTSMATPHVTGAIALLLQAYSQLYGVDLGPASVKALLMSSAVDFGYDRNIQGAGMIDITQAFIWHKDLNYKTNVRNGEWVNIPFQVDDKISKLTITVTWADPPAPNHNNIDAYLYDSELKEVDYSISVNDNVERIIINNPSAKGKMGTWQLGLYGRQVQGSQPVAVSIFPSYASVEITQCPDSVNKDDSFTVQVKVNQATPPSSIVSPIARDNVIPTRVTISLNNRLELNVGETYTKEVPTDGIVSWSVKAKQTGEAPLTVFVVSESGNNYISRSVKISEPGGGGGPGCWCAVATASTGTDASEGLNILRRFRDLSLQKNLPGQIFVQMYYRYGPRIAWSMIDRNELRTVARTAFVEPVMATSDIALGITSNRSLRFLVQLASFAALLAFVAVPIRIRLKRKRHLTGA